MNIIKNFDSKNEELFKIIRNNLWDNNKTEFDYLEESSALLFLIEGINTPSELATKIADYYLVNKIDDKFANYEEICKKIAEDYLLALKKIKS